ncbi:MAG: hypothetical protein HY319_06250 [Armatimonadetes bacterium]|nr:hypothetical protein [Armatimonadota bacterium]
MLLAVDLGLRTGFALYSRDGRLLRYFSRSFPSRSAFRRGIRTLVSEMGALDGIVVEGSGDLLRIWQQAATSLGVPLRSIAAETWRADLLLPRERRSGAAAKQSSRVLARKVISWSGLGRPTSLLDDASEAILVGLWAVIGLGWAEPPPGLTVSLHSFEPF